MHSTLVFVLLLACCVQMNVSKPIVEPAEPIPFGQISERTGSQLDDPNQREEADEFIRSNGVTKEEIEEYNRITGFNPPADHDMGEERMFGLGHMLKFWNWNMYDRFRQWVHGRRQTTTHSPVVVVNQFTRPSYLKGTPSNHTTH